MDFFKDFSKYILIDTSNNIIGECLTKFDDFHILINYIYLSWISKKQCILCLDETEDLSTRTNIINKDKIDGIYFCYNKDTIFIPWNIFFQLNEFFNKKLPYNLSNVDKKYRLETNIFNIFFLKFIANNIELYDINAKLCLVGNNGYFGIYNSYCNIVENTVFNFYFSFAIGSFILMNCIEDGEFITGKLLPWLKWNKESNSIQDYMNQKVIECPSSFKELNGLFALRKKCNKLVPVNNVKNNQTYKLNNDEISKPSNIINFVNEIDCQYCITFKINNIISVDKIEFIQKYIDGKVVYNEDTLIIYFPYKSIFKIEKLMDYIDKWSIVNIPINYVKKYNTDNLNGNKKFAIHIISEIYFLVFFILLFLPKFFFNITNVIPEDIQEKYTHMNYKFTTDEINIIWRQKNSIYKTKKDYLKALFLKTLSVFMSNYGVIVLENDINDVDNVKIDIYPLSPNLKNDEILKLYSCNEKAYYSKKLLFNLLNKINEHIYDGFEIPIVIINLIEMDTFNNISVEKLLCNTDCGKIPIIINAFFNENTKLNISLSYKKKYSKLKYVFNEFIQQLLE